MQQPIQSIKKQSGFTLIESILTLFILTIGILGVAGLQMQGMRSANLAIQRMAVTVKTQDLFDRMRANSANIADYATSGATNNGCNTGTSCSAAQMVSHDLFMWRNDLTSALPGVPTLNINIVASVVTVAVQWTDRGDNYSYTVTTQI